MTLVPVIATISVKERDIVSSLSVLIILLADEVVIGLRMPAQHLRVYQNHAYKSRYHLPARLKQPGFSEAYRVFNKVVCTCRQRERNGNGASGGNDGTSDLQQVFA